MEEDVRFRNDNLTNELARLGIPNPFAELRLTRNDNYLLFGRTYLGHMTVSDEVTVPHGQELYRRCADGDLATMLIFDETGDGSHRPAPPEDRAYAIVNSPNFSLFWRRLEIAVELQVKDDYFIYGDELIATYGLPEGAEAVPDESAGPPQEA